MAGRESRSDVPNLFREDAAVRDTESGRAGLDGGSLRAGAEKKQRRIDAAAHEAREDLDRDVLPFLAVEGANVDEPEGRRGRDRSVDESLGGKAVRNHRDPRPRDSGRFERRGHGRGDGEKAARGSIFHAGESMSGRAKDDAPVDDERPARSRTAPHGGTVSARISRVKDVRLEEPGGPGHGQEETGRGFGAGRRLRHVDPAAVSQDLGERRPAPPDEPDRVATARKLREEQRRLPLAAAQRGAEVEGEQPHAAENSAGRTPRLIMSLPCARRSPSFSS
jgi:hypothetical protein